MYNNKKQNKYNSTQYKNPHNSVLSRLHLLNRKPHFGSVCCIVLYRLLYHITLLKLVLFRYIISSFCQIAFPLYLVDVKGPKTNLVHIHDILLVWKMTIIG